MQINDYIINNTPIYHLNTNKFKTNLFGFSFILPLSKKYLPEFTILSQMWTKHTCSYQTERDFSLALNELFDSQIFYNFEKKGKALQITFYLHVINEKYIDKKYDLTNKVFNLFKEVVFTKKNITKKILEQEKLIYKETFESKISNCLYLTNILLFQNMFREENYLNHLDVTNEDVDKISLESINEAYNLIINASRFGFAIGDIDKNDLEKLFSNIPNGNANKIDFIDRESMTPIKVKTKIFPELLPQSTLMIGYRVDCLVDSKDYYAMCVLNNYLGGGYESLLIKVLREEHNLVYQINSEYDWYKGIMIINCGLSFEDYEYVYQLIYECLNEIQNGYIDSEIFSATKSQMISNQLEIEDNLISLIELINQKYFYGNSSLDNLTKIKKINNVTEEDLIEVSKKIITDTVIILGKDK